MKTRIQNYIQVVFGFVLICTMAMASLQIQAQTKDEKAPDTEGKDFWFAFLPNYHDTPATDSLHIFITSEFATKGRITYNKLDNGVYEQHAHNFTIDKPNEIYKFSLQYYSYELAGLNDNGTIIKDGQDNEKITKKIFRVQTDSVSTVYGLSASAKSAESFIVLPTTAIGQEYYVLAHNSNRAWGFANTDATPSQIVIVATENNTNVTIKPNCNTYKNKNNNVQNITMNRGDTYLLQAEAGTDLIIFEISNRDLSGTYIKADKNIAVFTGNQRSAIPQKNYAWDSYTRGCLIEQLIPVNAWGRNAIITPFVDSKKSNNPSDNDLFRVIAAGDSTKIHINGKHITTLKAGGFYEEKLIAGLITANKPIMVMQYRRSEKDNGCGNPLMVAVSPVEQYKDKYNVMCPSIMYGQNRVFSEHYFTIIAPDSNLHNIYVDTILIPPSDFISIPGSTYSYAQIKTTDNGHKITASANISVQIYGYGTAISYGYLGGMKFRNIGKEKSVLDVAPCYDAAKWTYNEIFSSGIKSYEVLSTVNCNIDEISFDSKKLELQVDKENVNKNSYFAVKIIDIYDEATTIVDTVQTIGLTVSGVVDDDALYFDAVAVGQLQKKDIYLLNSAFFPAQIEYTDMYFSNKILFTTSAHDFPINLAVGDSAKVSLYYAPVQSVGDSANVDSDILTINGVYYDVSGANVCKMAEISLSGKPIADTADFYDNCQLPIRAVLDSVNLETYIPQVYPNPATSQSIYKFVINELNYVKIMIVNQMGQTVETLIDGELRRGEYEIELPIERLTTGNYFIKYISNTQRKIDKLVIAK